MRRIFKRDTQRALLVNPQSPSPSRRLSGLDAHHRFILSTLAGVLAFFLAGKLLIIPRFLVSWDVFSFVGLVLAWVVLSVEDPYEVKRTAKIEDSSATFLFVMVISAAMISLLAAGLLLRSGKSLPPAALAGDVSIAVATVLVSWGLVHTLFALRYAHLYYFNASENPRDQASGGLEFPGKESPGYLDFAYFSFVIGMTFQVSDVQISSSRLRRVALVHGLISFCFNTAILAMFVNIIAGLA